VSNGVYAPHPANQAMVQVFKPRVEELTEGRIIVECYHSGQLGNDTVATNALRSGELEMCITSTAPLTGLIKELSVFDLPFLFNDVETADKVLDGSLGEEISLLAQEYGLVNLAWGENGIRQLTTREKLVKTLEDLKGMKIRTMENKLHLELWRALGANPTPISGGEMMVALEQGAVDGQENPIPNIYASKVHEMTPYFTLTGHVYSPFMFLYSKKLFDKLSEEDQQIILSVAKEAMQFERKLNRQMVVEDSQAMLEEGCEIYELPPEEKERWVEATKPIWDSVRDIVGDEFMDKLYEALK